MLKSEIFCTGTMCHRYRKMANIWSTILDFSIGTMCLLQSNTNICRVFEWCPIHHLEFAFWQVAKISFCKEYNGTIMAITLAPLTTLKERIHQTPSPLQSCVSWKSICEFCFESFAKKAQKELGKENKSSKVSFKSELSPPFAFSRILLLNIWEMIFFRKIPNCQSKH